jgi:ABC-type transporter Mla subunit MlaD
MIGLTAILGVAGLVVTLVVFGELSDVGKSYYRFTLHMQTARGLSVDGPVTHNGVRVGRIESIVHTRSPEPGVDVVVQSETKHEIPRDFVAFIDRGLVGATVLDLVTEPVDWDAGLIANGDRFDREATSTIKQIQDQLAGPMAALGETSDDIKRLVATYDSVGNRINDLLEPRSPEDVAQGAAPNLRSTLARADRVMTDLQRWTADDGLRADASEAIRTARDAAERASKTIDTANQTLAAWKSAAEGVSNQSARAGEKIDTLASDASLALDRVAQASDQLRQTLAGVNEGRGTLGQLATNPDLYNAAVDAARRFDTALAEFELLIEKLKAEGLRVGL